MTTLDQRAAFRGELEGQFRRHCYQSTAQELPYCPLDLGVEHQRVVECIAAPITSVSEHG